MCPYIPLLTEEHKATRSSVNRGIYWIFYITPILAASPDKEPTKQGTYSRLRQQDNDNLSWRHINQWQSIESLQQYIVIILWHKYITTRSRHRVIVGATTVAPTGSSHVQNRIGVVMCGRWRRLLWTLRMPTTRASRPRPLDLWWANQPFLEGVVP
jgi:hypothetical protein